MYLFVAQYAVAYRVGVAVYSS